MQEENNNQDEKEKNQTYNDQKVSDHNVDYNPPLTTSSNLDLTKTDDKNSAENNLPSTKVELTSHTTEARNAKIGIVFSIILIIAAFASVPISGYLSRNDGLGAGLVILGVLMTVFTPGLVAGLVILFVSLGQLQKTKKSTTKLENISKKPSSLGIMSAILALILSAFLAFLIWFGVSYLRQLPIVALCVGLPIAAVCVYGIAFCTKIFIQNKKYRKIAFPIILLITLTIAGIFSFRTDKKLYQPTNQVSLTGDYSYQISKEYDQDVIIVKIGINSNKRVPVSVLANFAVGNNLVYQDDQPYSGLGKDTLTIRLIPSRFMKVLKQSKYSGKLNLNEVIIFNESNSAIEDQKKNLLTINYDLAKLPGAFATIGMDSKNPLTQNPARLSGHAYSYPRKIKYIEIIDSYGYKRYQAQTSSSMPANDVSWWYDATITRNGDQAFLVDMYDENNQLIPCSEHKFCENQNYVTFTANIKQ